MGVEHVARIRQIIYIVYADLLLKFVQKRWDSAGREANEGRSLERTRIPRRTHKYTYGSLSLVDLYSAERVSSCQI